ncbi:acyl-CoA synthetase, partial [Geobacillus sp. LEMMJ02]
LTGVGKIFKPELKRRETRDALQAALAQAGAPCTSLYVNTDDAGRMSVAVALSDPALEAAARSVLGRFPFAFSISIAAHPMRPA